MDLDKILHGQKNFGEMEDADIEQFLKARRLEQSIST